MSGNREGSTTIQAGSAKADSLGQAIADHILADTSRWDGREAFWPLLREVVEAPAEIWVGFARSSASGRVALRRRYVRAVQVTRNRALVLVADADGREWSGITFHPAPLRRMATVRMGYRLFWSEDRT